MRFIRWGAVLNEHLEARGFWSAENEQQHMHEDNHAVRHNLTGMTSRSPVMMEELQRLWCLLETNNINLRTRYT
jgi:hypothetical protein